MVFSVEWSLAAKVIISSLKAVVETPWVTRSFIRCSPDIFTSSELDYGLDYIFSHWGQLRDSYAIITEVSNAHWCSRRKNDPINK